MRRTELRKCVIAMGIMAAAGAAVGCDPAPEEVCDSYMKLRDSDHWSTSDDVEEACKKEMAEIQDKSGGWYQCVSGCVTKADDVEGAQTCPMGCASYGKDDGVDEDDVREEFAYGIAAEASGEWAEKKKGKIDKDDCADAAYAIAKKRVKLGIIEWTDEKDHRKKLKKACKKNREDPTYAKKVRCMRRVAEDEDKFTMCAVEGHEG
jgi:hypothetical protein